MNLRYKKIKSLKESNFSLTKDNIGTLLNEVAIYADQLAEDARELTYSLDTGELSSIPKRSHLELNYIEIKNRMEKILNSNIVESLKEGWKDFAFIVKCNDGPKELVRVIAEDRSKAEEYAKKMYAQNHTTYADDRHNIWSIEESVSKGINESYDNNESVIRYPNGMEVTDVDLDRALDYQYGTDRDMDNSKYTDEEKQRAVTYWINKTNPNPYTESKVSEEDTQYGVHSFSQSSIIFRGTEEECAEFIADHNLWDDAEIYAMTPDDPHYLKEAMDSSKFDKLLDKAFEFGYNYGYSDTFEDFMKKVKSNVKQSLKKDMLIRLKDAFDNGKHEGDVDEEMPLTEDDSLKEELNEDDIKYTATGRKKLVSDETMYRAVEAAKTVDPNAKRDYDDDFIYGDDGHGGSTWVILLNGDGKAYSTWGRNAVLTSKVEKAVNDAADAYWADFDKRWEENNKYLTAKGIKESALNETYYAVIEVDGKERRFPFNNRDTARDYIAKAQRGELPEFKGKKIGSTYTEALNVVREEVKPNIESKDELLKESYLDNLKNPDYWQHQVDYQLEKTGRVGGGLIQDLDEAGFYLDTDNKVVKKLHEDTTKTPKIKWTFIKSKEVEDSDGFLTDYTWYEGSDGTQVMVFGDNDIYKPEDGYFDITFTDRKQAEDWFNSY